MVEICQYKEGDIDKVLPNLRAVYRDEITSIQLNASAQMHRVASTQMHLLTFWHEEKVVAVTGGRPLSHGVLQLWGLISNESSRVALDFTRSVKFVVSEFLQKYHRVQISVRAGYDAECRWAELLGFTREGLMKSYGPDKHDYWLYGRVA